MGIILSTLRNSTFLDSTVARLVAEQTTSFTNPNATAPSSEASVTVIDSASAELAVSITMTANQINPPAGQVLTF
jgi:TFIIF-interacting CTD phosphatase-like protein